VLREFPPRKVNLASLGNAVPHLHWTDSAPRRRSPFSETIWAEPSRAHAASRAAPNRGTLAAALKQRLA